jgi:predicted enzyme related to lactoylglutathione lyase
MVRHKEIAPMKILGINRAELVVADPNAGADVLSELFGMEFETEVTESHGVLSRTDFGSGLELAGPTGEGSAMQSILEARGEGLLTIVFRVDSIDELLARAEEKGLTVLVDLDYGDGMPRYKHYRQVSLASDRFPAGASFTFAEYEER